MLETVHKLAAAQVAAYEVALAYQVWLAAAATSVCLAALSTRARVHNINGTQVLRIGGNRGN